MTQELFLTMVNSCRSFKVSVLQTDDIYYEAVFVDLLDLLCRCNVFSS